VLPLLLAAGSALLAQEDREQERAIAELRKLGATVRVDEQETGKAVVAVDLSGCLAAINDATLVHLRTMNQIRTLDL
jgi:hypothetical protein